MGFEQSNVGDSELEIWVELDVNVGGIDIAVSIQSKHNPFLVDDHLFAGLEVPRHVGDVVDGEDHRHEVVDVPTHHLFRLDLIEVLKILVISQDLLQSFLFI